jgi:hypothetical protein
MMTQGESVLDFTGKTNHITVELLMSVIPLTPALIASANRSATSLTCSALAMSWWMTSQ